VSLARRSLRVANDIYDLSYEILNPHNEPTILFLHGWGSDKEVMKQAFAKELPHFRHIYLDMPGFGRSIEPPRPLDTYGYASVVRAFLEELGIEPDVVAGHSFGGKVATLLDPKLLVLLSSAGILWPKPLSTRLKIAAFKALKPFGGAKLRRFFVASDAKDMSPVMYETFKRVVDEDFAPVFGARKGRALLFWGDADTATPPKSGRRIAELMEDASLEILPGDHYFFLRHAPHIAKRIADEKL